MTTPADRTLASERSDPRPRSPVHLPRALRRDGASARAAIRARINMGDDDLVAAAFGLRAKGCDDIAELIEGRKA